MLLMLILLRKAAKTKDLVLGRALDFQMGQSSRKFSLLGGHSQALKIQFTTEQPRRFKMPNSFIIIR